MKVLSPRVHGYIDYLLVVVFLLAPTLLGFGGTAATLCYVVAAVHVGMSLFTAYPLGAVKAIPFTVHGWLETGAAVFLIAAPWIFAFHGVPESRNFFVAGGIAVVLVRLLTDYRAVAPEDRRHRAHVYSEQH